MNMLWIVTVRRERKLQKGRVKWSICVSSYELCQRNSQHAAEEAAYPSNIQIQCPVVIVSTLNAVM